MQKKLIALAVAGLMSGAAFAQTSVTIGGKFDASYQFKKTANADKDGVAQGGKTTETLGDGGNSTSRITFGAKEQIAPGYDIRVDLDLRFGTIEEGKNSTTTGGINANDKKAMAFTTPFGTLQWGVANLASNEYKLAEKPYMVSPKDTEIVKFGVSQAREESLTNRNTTYWSPVFNLGPVKTLVKGTFAIGDNQKSGASNVDNASSGNVIVLGNEGVVLDGLVDWGFDVTDVRPTAQASGVGGLGRNFSHAYLNIRPIPGNKNLKISTQYNVYKGATALEGFYKEKNTNFVVSYNFNGKAEIGAAISHLNDLGSNRNSGKGFMIGGSYFLSKSVQLYAGVQKTNFARNESITNGKYAGTAANFSTSLNKLDDRYVRVGIMKEF